MGKSRLTDHGKFHMSSFLLWLCPPVTRSYMPLQFTYSHSFTYGSGLKFDVLGDGTTHAKCMAGYAEGKRLNAAASTSAHGVTVSKYLFGQPMRDVYGTVSWWVNAFSIASSSKYVIKCFQIPFGDAEVRPEMYTSPTHQDISPLRLAIYPPSTAHQRNAIPDPHKNKYTNTYEVVLNLPVWFKHYIAAMRWCN
jgi:hypothetical protein